MDKVIYSACNEIEAAIVETLGPVVTEYLSRDDVQELSANYDPPTGMCRLFADFGTGPMQELDTVLKPEAIVIATLLLATGAGKSLNARAPILNCVLVSGCRYHAVLVPSADGPGFSVRLHNRRDWKLTDYGITASQISLLKAAIRDQKTILISGKTIAGKTSFASALLALIDPGMRVLIVEDEMELQIDTAGRDITRRRATEDADFQTHVVAALRARPDYLVLGEIRGAEAADVLEAASSGHPGLSTIHASSINECLARLQRLAKCDRGLVEEAIDVVVQLVRQPDGRREVVEVRELL
jgi:pilus assembly protein CpaF